MFDPDQLITQRLRDIDASGIRKVFDLAAKIKDPINLSIGQPHFDVPDPIRRAASDAIHAGRNQYTQTQGIAELREAALQRFQTDFAHDGLWSDPGVLITSGVSGGLLLALMTCVEPGDEVLIPDPYFVMYKHLVTMAGGKAVYVDTYPDFQLTAERVSPLLTERTKMILVSSPSNPTGVVTTAQTFRELTELAERENVLLLSDEIYDAFCYDRLEHHGKQLAPSPAMFSDHVLILRGYSKSYAMTGWRMGYAIGPNPIIEQMTKLQQYTFVCAPSMVQHAGLTAMEIDLSRYIADYQQKRDRVVERLGAVMELCAPRGAFYAFPKAPGGSGAAFVERAIARNVLIIPGNVFSERDTHFRLSYATDDQTLEKGLDVLVELAAG
jgi:aspartate/methionine/tyrosine aminotransferase